MGETRLMSSGGDCGPFILRFSKSMHRPNPRKIMGGSPRRAPGKSLNTHTCAESLRNGFNYYKDFEYNSAHPVFVKMVLKPGSMAKSLRYHFLKTIDAALSASLSGNTLVFPVKDSQKLNHLTGMLIYSRNSAFRASLSHMDDISVVSVEDKMALSPAPAEITSKYVLLNLFPDDSGTDALLNFMKYQINAMSCNIAVISGKPFLKVKSAEIRDRYEIIFTHSLISTLLLEPEIYLHEQYVRHDNLPLECVLPRDFSASYPKAGLVDSGVCEDSYLKEWEIDTVSCIDQSGKDPRHGTFVCGRLLENEERFGGITYLNIEIVPAGGGLSLHDFEKHMIGVLDKYHKTVKIYNISLGSNVESGNVFSPAAAVLDRLQYEFGVLFIISAGNTQQTILPGERISTPAESVNSITVGSVAHIGTNIQERLSPSLFTRHGPGPWGMIKPEVASFGGAHEKRYGKLRSIGVFSIGANNELAEDSGTSHAAPLVTAAAAKLYDRYSHAFKNTDITKAMIIHYTYLSNMDREPCMFRGFGVLPEELAAEDSYATFIHEGKTPSEGIVELNEIPLPTDMFRNGKATGEIVLTLSYKAKTDINFPHFYTLFNLEASLGYYRNGRWTSILTTKDLVTIPEKDRKKGTVSEKLRWSPTKVLRRQIRDRNIPISLSLRLMASKRDFYTENPEISYGIAVSFIHMSKNLYQCLRNMSANDKYMIEHSSDMWKTCG